MAHDESVTKVAELLRGQRIGMLTTVDPDGTIMSRPMALQEVEFDGSLWFFVERGSREISQIEARPQVNVAVSDTSTWISLTGQATVVDDVDKKRELWNAGVEAWLPQGAEDPSVLLIRVDADSAEYWDAPGGRVTTAFSFAKAKLTGKPFSGAENERVEL